MILLAIDPGPETSGVVMLDAEQDKIILAEQAAFDRVRFLLVAEHERWVDTVLCEAITPQQTMGTSVIETAYIVGRIQERCAAARLPCFLIPRRDVKRALALGKANDAVVHAELESRGWVKGTKKSPGPAYGVSGHCWQALALYVAWKEMQTVKHKETP